jgi:hypothetical protein
MLFPTDESAQQYFEERVPDPEDVKDVDLEPFKERLFDIPDELRRGEYEFMGPNGLKISFRLETSQHYFSNCYADLRDDEDLQGIWNPIYSIHDLTIETPNFSYSLKYPASQNHARVGFIYWLRGVNSGDDELTHDYVNIGKKKIYLLDEDGFMSRPLDLLGFFHEVAHIETDPDLPHNEDTQTYNEWTGTKPRTKKMTAYELQREEVANEWVKENCMALFEDLGFTPEQVADFYDHVQLKSYHEMVRSWYMEAIEE